MKSKKAIKMKNFATIFGAVIFTSVVLTGCGGNSMESDAKEVADLWCELGRLLKSDELLDKIKAGSLDQEILSLKIELHKKYTSDSAWDKFGLAVEQELLNCK